MLTTSTFPNVAYLSLKFLTGFNFISLVIFISILYLVIFFSSRKRKKNNRLDLKPLIIFFSIFLLTVLGSNLILSNWKTSSRNSCERYNGLWYKNDIGAPILYDKPFSCNLPTKDGGKICQDNSECESYCVPIDSLKVGELSSGKCYQWNFWPDFGCTPVLKQGKVVMGPGCSI